MLLIMVINKIQESCIHLFRFGELLNISPKNFVFLKTSDSEFSYIEVWFTYGLLMVPLEMKRQNKYHFSY